jgi:peptidoglycan/LPS O-acetylase OafA/YrhL
MKAFSDHLIGYYTLFGNYTSGAHGYPTVPTLQHLWTVTLEEQFYIVWPIVLILLLRAKYKAFPWAMLGILLVSTLCLRLHFHSITRHPFLWTNTLTRLDPLVMGIALAFWRHKHPPKSGWLLPLIKATLGSGLVCAIAFAPLIETQSASVIWQFLSTAAGFTLILDAALPFGTNPISKILSSRVLVWLGKLTYGLYVYHILGLQLGGALVRRLHSFLSIDSPPVLVALNHLISLTLTITIAAISYRYFESYFLRLKGRFARVQSRPTSET